MTIGPTNEVTQAIAERRTARNTFDGRVVDEVILREIVASGLAAPSSKNAKPWRLHVVTDPHLIATIGDLAARAPRLEEYVATDAATGQLRPWDSSVAVSAALLRTAPAAVFIENRGVFSSGRSALVAADQDVLDAALVGYTFEAIGLGAAIQNMLIAAHSLGVNAAFMGDVLIIEETIGSILGIECDLAGVIVLGYGAGASPTPGALHDDPSLAIWH
jgi:nitroreductase